MTYEFSLVSFFIGLIILAVGVALLKWHRVIADNLGNGVMSYDKFKLWAFITCVVGVVVMINLHVVVLSWLVNLVFRQ